MEMLPERRKGGNGEKLGRCWRMPCAHWTRASIEDAFLDWFWTHGRLPSTRALDNTPGLPCHGTIRKCLGVPMRSSRRRFCAAGAICCTPRLRLDERGGAANAFPPRIRAPAPDLPRALQRPPQSGTPSALAIARALTLEGTWEALLAHLGLTRYYPRRAATAPRGQACAAAADSPAQRLERYLERFRDHEARVEAALVRAEARARTQPAAKRAPRGTFDGAYETDFSIGARTSEKR